MYTPVIKPRKLKETTDLLDHDRFFRLLSERSNYSDPELIEDVYMAMVKLINDELRVNYICHLPFLGSFAIVDMKPSQKVMGRVGKQPILGWGPRRSVLKFYPKQTWKLFLAKRRKQREDLLGR